MIAIVQNIQIVADCRMSLLVRHVEDITYAVTSIASLGLTESTKITRNSDYRHGLKQEDIHLPRLLICVSVA